MGKTKRILGTSKHDATHFPSPGEGESEFEESDSSEHGQVDPSHAVKRQKVVQSNSEVTESSEQLARQDAADVSGPSREELAEVKWTSQMQQMASALHRSESSVIANGSSPHAVPNDIDSVQLHSISDGSGLSQIDMSASANISSSAGHGGAATGASAMPQGNLAGMSVDSVANLGSVSATARADTSAPSGEDETHRASNAYDEVSEMHASSGLRQTKTSRSESSEVTSGDTASASAEQQLIRRLAAPTMTCQKRAFYGSKATAERVGSQVEGESVTQSLALNAEEIREVRAKIEEVEQLIEQEKATDKNGRYMQALLDKEKQLRDKENILLAERKYLRQEKIQLPAGSVDIVTLSGVVTLTGVEPSEHQVWDRLGEVEFEEIGDAPIAIDQTTATAVASTARGADSGKLGVHSSGQSATVDGTPSPGRMLLMKLPTPLMYMPALDEPSLATNNRRLVIRSEAIKVADVVLQHLRRQVRLDLGVVGIPGIGKSLLSNYLLKLCWEEDVPVVVHDLQDNVMRLLRRGEPTLSVPDDADKRRRLLQAYAGQPVLYLCDTGAGTTRQPMKVYNFTGVTVLTTPPDKSHFLQWGKTCILLWLPPWSEAELRVALPYLLLDPSEANIATVMRRYEVVGGTLRQLTRLEIGYSQHYPWTLRLTLSETSMSSRNLCRSSRLPSMSTGGPPPLAAVRTRRWAVARSPEPRLCCLAASSVHYGRQLCFPAKTSNFGRPAVRYSDAVRRPPNRHRRRQSTKPTRVEQGEVQQPKPLLKRPGESLDWKRRLSSTSTSTIYYCRRFGLPTEVPGLESLDSRRGISASGRVVEVSEASEGDGRSRQLAYGA